MMAGDSLLGFWLAGWLLASMLTFTPTQSHTVHSPCQSINFAGQTEEKKPRLLARY